MSTPHDGEPHPLSTRELDALTDRARGTSDWHESRIIMRRIALAVPGMTRIEAMATRHVLAAATEAKELFRAWANDHDTAALAKLRALLGMADESARLEDWRPETVANERPTPNAQRSTPNEAEVLS